ncbi:MAG: hypothetical protein H0W13_03270 [Nitrospirales bacterium]|nr:hypothetical protein [Nitrospirales bacterium]
MEPDRRAVAHLLLVVLTSLAILADCLPASAQLDRLRKSKKDGQFAHTEPAPSAMIPAGEFWMGVDGLQGLDDERPRHPVLLNAYAMDLYEVTVGVRQLWNWRALQLWPNPHAGGAL